MKKQSDLFTQMEKPLLRQMTYYKLFFQCYLFVLSDLLDIFIDFYFFALSWR